MASDDHAGGPVALEAAHRSQPRLESAVVCFDTLVGVSAGVVNSQRHQIYDRVAQSVVTSAGSPCTRMAPSKNLVAAARSHVLDTSTSMTRPYWSTAR